MPTNIFPFAGTSPGTAGPYSDKQFAAFVQGLWNNGGDPGDSGVVPYSNGGAAPTGLLLGFGCDVTAAAVPNMSVNVGPGTAVVNGRWVQQTALQNLAVTANSSGNTRIDTVVFHVDFTLQTVTLQINLGTPSGTPVPPGMVQSSLIWEIPIADITVVNLATSITQANIQPRQVPADPNSAIYLPVLNNSGAVLQVGDVVVWDTSAQQAVKTTTTLEDLTVAGVMAGRTAVGAIGVLLIKGIGWVNMASAITNGNAIVANVTAKTATAAAFNTIGTFAYAMSTTTGSGLAPAFIDCSRVAQSNFNYIINNSMPRGVVLRNNGANYSTTSGSAVAVDATNLKVTITPISGNVLVTIVFPELTNSSSSRGEIYVNVDGVSSYEVWSGVPTTNHFGGTASIMIPVSAGVSHTFEMYWSTSGGGTLVMNANGLFTGISAVALMN